MAMISMRVPAAEVDLSNYVTESQLESYVTESQLESYVTDQLDQVGTGVPGYVRKDVNCGYLYVDEGSIKWSGGLLGIYNTTSNEWGIINTPYMSMTVMSMTGGGLSQTTYYIYCDGYSLSALDMGTVYSYYGFGEHYRVDGVAVRSSGQYRNQRLVGCIPIVEADHYSMDDWYSGEYYYAGDMVSNDYQGWVCIQNHESGTDDEPGRGANYEDYWEEAGAVLPDELIYDSRGISAYYKPGDNYYYQIWSDGLLVGRYYCAGNP